VCCRCEHRDRGGSLYLGYHRSGDTANAPGFLFAGILAMFGLLAVVAVIWLLFDENVAKPIDRIAAAMRTRAHADVEASVDLHAARYLGDLAHAVHAVTGELSKATAGADEIVASETAQLAAERAHLALLLTEIPVAIVLVSPTHQIMLYDGQAAGVLGQVHVPRLSASIFDYFVEEDLRSAHSRLSDDLTETVVKARGTRGNLSFDLRLKSLSQASGYMILVDSTHARDCAGGFSAADL
jgi:DNA polymerase-3 subunit epsilon